LDSARARRSEKKTGASAGSPGPARADARAEIDGSRLKHKYTTLKEIDDPVLTKAYRAYKEWNVNELRRRLRELPYADEQVNFYFAKHCRGVVKMHYPPFSESGPDTNLCLNVHKSRTAKEGRPIFKLKSSCMQLSTYSIAHWLVPDEEKYDYEEILVSGVSDADDDFSVSVDKRSALALDLDQVEMFPTFYDNKVNIRKELTAEYGKEEADKYMKKAGELYAAFVRARQAQVLRDTDKKPPVYLWNVGRIDIGKSLGGAQLDVWNAWQRPFPARDVFPSYHPAFLIRGTPLAKLAAKIADDNVKAFAEAILPAEAFLPAGATASANAGRLVAAASASASASAIAAPPPPSPPPSPSTPIAARTRPGFWEGIHGVANMTEKKREELRRDVLAHYQGMCDKFRDMIDAVELVENLERPATEEEQNAHDAALPSVQKWRDGRDKWRDMIDAVELVENLERPATEEEQNAHDAALPSVQKWRDGRDKWRDMIDAVELVENLVSAGIEPSVEQQNAHDDALPAVRRQRAGRANGSDKMKDMNAAVKLVENCKEAGIVPNAKELKAHADALPSVQGRRDGLARANDARLAPKAAAAAEAAKAAAEAAAVAEAKAAKAAAVAEAKAAKAAAVAEARSAKAAAAREPRVLAVRAVLLRDRENGLAIPRIAEDVKAFAAFENMPRGGRVNTVRLILQVHGRNLFKQTCPEDKAVGKLAKYGVVMSEIDADDERS
jgi:hypothetical protein